MSRKLAFIEPELATLVDEAPAGEGWVHEIKFDGYRVGARIAGGKVTMLTRRGLDWTERFRSIAEELRGLLGEWDSEWSLRHMIQVLRRVILNATINPNSADETQLREMVQTLQNWALLAA